MLGLFSLEGWRGDRVVDSFLMMETEVGLLLISTLRWNDLNLHLGV